MRFGIFSTALRFDTGQRVFSTSGEGDAFRRVMSQLVNLNAQIEVVKV